MVIWLIPKVPALWFCTLVTVMLTNSLLSYHFRCNMVGLTLSCPWLILWPCMTQTDLPGKAEGCLTCIHLWLWSHKAYLHNICASFSAAWETCAGASTGLALSVCVCVSLFPPYLHSPIFIWSTEAQLAHTTEAQMSTSSLPILFSSSCSFYSHSSCSCSSAMEAAVVCSLTSFRFSTHIQQCFSDVLVQSHTPRHSPSHTDPLQKAHGVFLLAHLSLSLAVARWLFVSFHLIRLIEFSLLWRL